MLSRTPLISVIVPCYNQGRYLREAARSVLDQTVSDLECLIVDDGATDETPDIIKALAKEDGRIRPLAHPGRANRGVAESRNLAIEAARGQFVAFLDADDAWLPNKLELQLAVFAAKPQTGLVYGKAAMIVQHDPTVPMHDADWRNGRLLGGVSGRIVAQPFDATEMLLFDDSNWITNWLPSPTPLVRACHLSGARFTQGPVCKKLGLQFEDYLMWLVMATKCPFYAMDDVLALYRVHSAQVTSEFLAGRGWLRALSAYEELFDSFQEQCGESLSGRITREDLNRRIGQTVVALAKRLPVRDLPRLSVWALRYSTLLEFFGQCTRRLRTRGSHYVRRTWAHLSGQAGK